MNPREPEGLALAVVSYNVHRCIGRDGKRDVARIARVLAEIDADLVALQEVEADALEELAAALGLEAIPGPTIDDRFGNGILTRLPIRDVRRTDLSVPGREPRGVVEAQLEGAEGPVRFAATHLGLSARERATQATRLVDLLTEASAEAPLVLAGDFNEWIPRGPALRVLRRRFGRTSAPRSFPSWRPLFALDRVWSDPVGLVRWTRTWSRAEARVASDHLPVLAPIGRVDPERWQHLDVPRPARRTPPMPGPENRSPSEENVARAATGFAGSRS